MDDKPGISTTAKVALGVGIGAVVVGLAVALWPKSAAASPTPAPAPTPSGPIPTPTGPGTTPQPVPPAPAPPPPPPAPQGKMVPIAYGDAGKTFALNVGDTAVVSLPITPPMTDWTPVSGDPSVIELSGSNTQPGEKTMTFTAKKAGTTTIAAASVPQGHGLVVTITVS